MYHITGPVDLDGIAMAEAVSHYTRGLESEDGGFEGFEPSFISCSRNEAKRILRDLCDQEMMGETHPELSTGGEKGSVGNPEKDRWRVGPSESERRERAKHGI